MFITIDTSELDETIGKLSQAPDYEHVEKALDTVGGYVANTLESTAYGILLPGMTRKVYWPEWGNTINHHMRGELEVEIMGDSQMTDKAVSARPARDMKPKLLMSSKVKISKDGNRYLRIPFGHSFEKLSTQSIHALVNNVRNFKTTVGMQTKLGSALGKGMGNYTYSTGTESNIFMGKSGPTTIRTVSDKSNPSSWWYPALKANPILEAVVNAVSDEIEQWIIEAWIEAIL